jgi:hypothetical protein
MFPYGFSDADLAIIAHAPRRRITMPDQGAGGMMKMMKMMMPITRVTPTPKNRNEPSPSSKDRIVFMPSSFVAAGAVTLPQTGTYLSR